MSFLPLLALLLVSASQISALTCDCGFNDPSDPTKALYTTYWETNFTTTSNAQLGQLYRHLSENLTKNALPRDFDPSNVAIDSSGVHLTVKGSSGGQPVPSAEIYTNNTDFGFGSYHWIAQTSPVPGTVSAFYVYFTDSNEVDMEYVSKTPDQDQTLLCTVKPQLFDPTTGAALNTTLATITPSFNLSDGFHDYSFVWNSTGVIFAIDGNWTNVSITTNVPQLPGVIALSHWSDGDPNYSGGPPAVDSVLTVNRVFTFYNATGATLPCVNSKAPCTVGEMAVNQTTGSGSSNSSSSGGGSTGKSGAGTYTPSTLVPFIGLLSIVSLFIA